MVLLIAVCKFSTYRRLAVSGLLICFNQGFDQMTVFLSQKLELKSFNGLNSTKWYQFRAWCKVLQ